MNLTSASSFCRSVPIALRQDERRCAEAQYRTIALSKAAADPAHLHSKEQEEQSRTLQSIMNREMPAGLFIADEVGALRDNLTIPQDDADAQDVQDTNR